MKATVWTAAFLAAVALLGRGAFGAELARFRCERPQPWEQGALRNVSAAAALIDGAVIAPGAVFSFNAAVASGRANFVEGTSFLAGREVRSVGGGICQVSSALYNAVLLAGLEVQERANHSLYDPAEAYVEPGRDAMVSVEGGSDFRFRNSTAHPLTLSARADGGAVEVAVFGVQRHARKRWISTEIVARDPARDLTRSASALAPGERRRVRPGFDGLTVRVSLCAAASGETQCTGVSLDHYARVDGLWRVGSERDFR